MRTVWKLALAVGVFALVAGKAEVASAQIQYARGQNVVPMYEGWIKNADGTIDMIFGYLNRNWEENIYIPVGPDNNITPDGPDRGQPTIFFHRKEANPPGARRESFVFKVRLPKDWGPKQELVWTLTAHGKTDKIVATLNPVEEIDFTVIAENRGGGIIAGNKPPTVTLKASTQKVAVGQPVTLTATYADDGLPKIAAPVRAADGSAPPARRRGPQVKWQYFRGPAVDAVSFKADATPIPAAEGTASTDVTFKQPGTYVLRAWAEDGPLYTTAEVTITVTGPAGQSGAQ